MWRRSFMLWVSLAAGLFPATAALDQSGAGRGGESPAQRWKSFAAAAGLGIPDADIEAIAATLDRLSAATREALQADLGFSEPVMNFRLPEGDR